MADVPRNPDGSYTLYNVNGVTVTLTFPADPAAGCKVVTKDVPGGLPANYTWVLNFGIQNPGGQYLPSASYSLQGTTPPGNKSWVIYHNGQAHAMNGSHTTPGDPPIGYG